MASFKDIIRDIRSERWIPCEVEASRPKGSDSGKLPVSEARQFCDASSDKPCITVCRSQGGCECGSEDVLKALVEAIEKRGLKLKVGAGKIGCPGRCDMGAIVGFPQRGFFYSGVRPGNVQEIVDETLIGGKVLFKHLSTSSERVHRNDLYFDKKTGLIAVLDDRVSMIGMAKYFMDFDAGVSCGKCIPCRIGLKRMQECIDRIAAGEGAADDFDQAKELAQLMLDAPFCEFASTSVKPVVSIMTYFEDEFRAVLKPAVPKAEEKKPAARKEKPKPDSSEKEEVSSLSEARAAGLEATSTAIPDATAQEEPKQDALLVEASRDESKEIPVEAAAEVADAPAEKAVEEIAPLKEDIAASIEEALEGDGASPAGEVVAERAFQESDSEEAGSAGQAEIAAQGARESETKTEALAADEGLQEETAAGPDSKGLDSKESARDVAEEVMVSIAEAPVEAPAVEPAPEKKKRKPAQKKAKTEKSAAKKKKKSATGTKSTKK